jgi:hypothetical protein
VSARFGESPTLRTMTLFGAQRFIASIEKIHKMGQAGANYALACVEVIESVAERNLEELFLALFGDAASVEQNAAETFAVFDSALFNHLDNFGELHQAKFDVLIVFGMGIAGHKAFR